MMGPIVAGLFAGNGVVVKCAESVAWSSHWFVGIAHQALKACGHDPSLVQLVSCWPDEADYLVGHPGIDHITFIGSRPVAHKVAMAASRSLTPLVVELGGKDPLIVLNDCNISSVARIIMRGTFQAAGQNCIGIERVIALPQAYEALVGELRQSVKSLRIGSSIDQSENIDIGATISDSRYEWLEKLVQDAVDKGATLVTGGHRWTHPKYPQGHYFSPTMLIDVTPSMAIAQEEVFGPVLLLMKANDVDNAVSIANSTDFGLGASVFGTNQTILEQITSRLRCGNVAINDFATYHVCQLPFGGIGGSGYGKFGGAEGLRGLSLEKSVVYDRVPFISTKIPSVLAYPIPDVKKAWDAVKAINDVGYGQGTFARLRALRVLAKSH
jgi:acyl-CoA reductase-like NAD-dependent aldehyde dehydrogenase